MQISKVSFNNNPKLTFKGLEEQRIFIYTVNQLGSELPSREKFDSTQAKIFFSNAINVLKKKYDNIAEIANRITVLTDNVVNGAPLEKFSIKNRNNEVITISTNTKDKANIASLEYHETKPTDKVNTHSVNSIIFLHDSNKPSKVYKITKAELINIKPISWFQ